MIQRKSTPSIRRTQRIRTTSHPQHNPQWQTVLQQLKRIPAKTIMAETNLSRSQVKAIRNGHALPHVTHQRRLLKVAQLTIS